MTPRRSELLEQSSGNIVVQPIPVAESVALPSSSAITDPNLLMIIEAWSTLPLACQKAILAIVNVGK